jgi:hypothetical protein
MKELIKTESSSNIMICVGFVGLAFYGYLLFGNNLSVEELKYSVFVCTIASLLPFALTIRRLKTDFSARNFSLIAIGSAAIFTLVAYSMVKATDDGILFDFFAVISSENFRWFYFAMLIISSISPLVWDNGAPWILGAVVGILIPIALYTILLILVFIIGFYILSLFGKSKGASSSGIGNWLSDLSNNNRQDSKPEQPKRSTVVDNRRYAWLDIEYCRRSDYEISGGRISNPYKAHECLPVDFTFDQIAKYLRKKYGKVDMVILNTKIDLYAGKDSVDSCAWKI